MVLRALLMLEVVTAEVPRYEGSDDRVTTYKVCPESVEVAADFCQDNDITTQRLTVFRRWLHVNQFNRPFWTFGTPNQNEYTPPSLTDRAWALTTALTKRGEPVPYRGQRHPPRQTKLGGCVEKVKRWLRAGKVARAYFVPDYGLSRRGGNRVIVYGPRDERVLLRASAARHLVRFHRLSWYE